MAAVEPNDASGTATEPSVTPASGAGGDAGAGSSGGAATTTTTTGTDTGNQTPSLKLSPELAKDIGATVWNIAGTIAESNPSIGKAAKQISVPPPVLPLVGLATLMWLTCAIFGTVTLVTAYGVVYPLLVSARALQQRSGVLHTYWLSYWLIFSFLIVVESCTNGMSWIPFYWVFKFAFVTYLMFFGGATVMFEKAARPAVYALAAALLQSSSNAKADGKPSGSAATTAATAGAGAGAGAGGSKDKDKDGVAGTEDDGKKFVLRT